MALSEQDAQFLALAREEAQRGLDEGGVPVGAVLVVDGEVRGRGHNRRVQDGSPIHHGETAAMADAGRLHASEYRRATMYTTLSPCAMCSGTIVLYGIPRVVIGERETFVGREDWLQAEGVELVHADDHACKQLMQTFIERHPEIWNEDIGETETNS